MKQALNEMDWSTPIRTRDIDWSQPISLPDKPGIYVWRRSFRKEAETIDSVEALERWLRRGLSVPLVCGKRLRLVEGSGARKSLRSRFLRLADLRIGGGILSSEKTSLLRERGRSMAWRSEFFLTMLTATELLGPVLYVGEAQSIRVRVDDHMSGRSGLRRRLENLNLTFDDLTLQYLETPDLSKAERELIEQCLTHILVAPLTVKAG